MKKWIVLLVLLALVVSVSGCTSQNTTNNKTYSANGVSFTYPGSWSEENTSTLQSELGSAGTVIVVVGDNSTNKFGVAKANLAGGQTISNVDEWASNYNSTMKNAGSTYVSEKKLTVDGVDASQMTFQNSGVYITDIFFIKNNVAYLAVLASTNNDQKILDLLLKNLKINQ